MAGSIQDIAIDAYRIESAKLEDQGNLAAGYQFGYRIAILVGSPKSSRAVANACGKNPFPITIPCHRVIKSDGSIGGYSAKGGIKRKRMLLANEVNDK